MKLAFLHHHLNRGGVTQVILNQLRALQSGSSALGLTDLLVLHGGRAAGFPALGGADGPLAVRFDAVNGLDYDDGEGVRADDLSERIAGALAAAGFGPDETIVHAHNHSLGKNVSLPGALTQLARRGYRLLLQIHDFAEDLRPDNFQRIAAALGSNSAADVGHYLYPHAPHIHYALLNSRDRSIFQRTQIDAAGVHLLPNPVTTAAELPSHEESLKRFREVHQLRGEQRVVLYPVRAIRRKNLGEILLWSTVADDQAIFAVTLPATSENEVPAFERWRRLAERLRLRVLFDVGVGGKLTFADNLAAASRIITTSVAEGFGLVFLESWLHQRPLIGRDLPEITRDFIQRGVDLGHLGDSVQIPMDWIGAQTFVDQMLVLHQELCAAYSQEVTPASEAVLRELAAVGHVDFASLPTRLQVAVIERAAQDWRAANEILSLNPWMQASLAGSSSAWQPLIDSNAAAVSRGFSLEATAGDLLAVYGALFATRPTEALASLPRPDNILHTFLDVTRLCPVRIEP